MTLVDLINIEYQHHLDRGLTSKELTERDQNLKIDRQLADSDLLSTWAKALRPQNFGQIVISRINLFVGLLYLLAVVVGSTLTLSLIRMKPGLPVNIFWAVAVILGPQTITLVLQIVSGFKSQLLSGLIHARIPQLSSLHYYRQIYGKIEKWYLLDRLQRLTLFFNFSVLITLSLLFSLTDVSFAWGTTLDFSSSNIALACKLISLPWFFYEAGIPNLELITKTQYSSFQQSYIHDSSLAGEWWRFLMLTVSIYGLLPRILLFAFARFRFGKALATVKLRHSDCIKALRRLRSQAHWEKHVEKSPSQAHSVPQKLITPKDVAQNSVDLIVWRDLQITDEKLRVFFDGHDCQVKNIFRFLDGFDDFSGNKTAEKISSGNVIICVDYWESYGKALRRFISGLNRPFVYLAPLKTKNTLGLEEETSWQDAVRHEPYIAIWEKHDT